jgi:hypothetical protein
LKTPNQFPARYVLPASGKGTGQSQTETLRLAYRTGQEVLANIFFLSILFLTVLVTEIHSIAFI